MSCRSRIHDFNELLKKFDNASVGGGRGGRFNMWEGSGESFWEVGWMRRGSETAMGLPRI